MAEESDGPEAGAEAPVAGVDAAAIALGGASRAKADAFLDNQSALIDIQKHHLHAQCDWLLAQLHLRVWEQRMGVVLRVATAFVGLAIAAGIGLMVWDAAHSKGLLIEPFSVPSDMASRGLTGEVVANQVLDKLATMTTSESSRSVQSYANNWGNDIKVEIPETGVSISELQRFLREWLGHDIRISGEVYRTAGGIAVTARTSGEPGATAEGPESDLDALVQKAAEHVYEVTQPYRYANYLDRNRNPAGLQDRVARATAIYRKLIAGDNPFERAWAWNGLGTIAFQFDHDNRQSAAYYRKALAAFPDFTIAYYALQARDVMLNQDEEDLTNLRQAARLLHRSPIPDLNPHYVPYARVSADGLLPAATGDYGAAIPFFKAGAELPDDFSVLARGSFIFNAFAAMTRQHDLGAVRAYSRDIGVSPAQFAPSLMAVDVERRDWRDILAFEAQARRGLPAVNGVPPGLGEFNQGRPEFALAHAELGDFALAEALIAPVTADNDDGLRTRALIAELEGQQARADWWFARAERDAPSIPFADTLWGQALLARGKPDAAIEKFTLASQKGPHFADPLEGWGEALMKQNHSDLALAKFEEAEKYAPNWGRLHLKWGEALLYAGRKDEAQKQFALAGQLDLTEADKAELLRATV